LLTGVLFLFAPVQGKLSPVSGAGINKKVVFKEIKNLNAPYRATFSDSLKANSRDTLLSKKHRLVAALLAFPLGIFGLHRAYLGTSPFVPFIYIFTLGGGLGVLPFIDFVMILLSRDKEFQKIYVRNHHIFMWHKGEIIRDTLPHK